MQTLTVPITENLPPLPLQGSMRWKVWWESCLLLVSRRGEMSCYICSEPFPRRPIHKTANSLDEPFPFAWPLIELTGSAHALDKNNRLCDTYIVRPARSKQAIGIWAQTTKSFRSLHKIVKPRYIPVFSLPTLAPTHAITKYGLLNSRFIIFRIFSLRKSLFFLERKNETSPIK